MAEAQLQVPEGEGLVLLGRTCSWLLEQHTCLQSPLEDLDWKESALEMESHLLKKQDSPEVCKEAEKLQKINAALALQLEGKSMQLQVSLHHLSSIQVPLPIQSSPEELLMAAFPQQRDGEMGDPTRAKLAQNKQRGFSQKAAEEPHVAAGEGGSCYIRTCSLSCGEFQVLLTVTTNENTCLAGDNTHLCRQLGLTEEVQAENADLKWEVAEEQDSAIHRNVCLQTQLEEAERKLKSMREMAERNRELEKQHKDLKSEVYMKVKEGKCLQRTQAEVQKTTLQLIQAWLIGLNGQFEKLNESSQQLFQELEQLERERSNSVISRLHQANLEADKESILLEAMRK